MLPIALGVAAGLGGAQALSGAFKSPYEKQLEERERKLSNLLKSGRGGLTGREEALATRAATDPVRGALSGMQSRNEAAAGMRGTSGAELSRMRQETQAATGEAIQRGADQVTRLDLEKERAQRAEVEQLRAAQQQMRDARKSKVFGGLSQMAMAGGALAGGVPEITRAAGLAGAPIRDEGALYERLKGLGISDENAAMVATIPGHKLTRLVNAVLRGDLSDPDAQKIAEVMNAAAQQGG